jgi:hypothetical protein
MESASGQLLLREDLAHARCVCQQVPDREAGGQLREVRQAP